MENNKKEKENEIQCAICLDDEEYKNKEFKVLDCTHKFHTICVQQIRNNKCPLCREIIDKNIVNNQNDNESIYDFIPPLISSMFTFSQQNISLVSPRYNSPTYSSDDNWSTDGSINIYNDLEYSFNSNDFPDPNVESLNDLERNNQIIDNNYNITTIVSANNNNSMIYTNISTTTNNNDIIYTNISTYNHVTIDI